MSFKLYQKNVYPLSNQHIHFEKKIISFPFFLTVKVKEKIYGDRNHLVAKCFQQRLESSIMLIDVGHSLNLHSWY